MPIISRIGARSTKVRLVYAFIYVILGVGAVTMIYPLMLMLAGSTKSEADIHLITPYPEFWFNDTILFRKYAETKYNIFLDNIKNAWGSNVTNWRRIEEPPAPEPAVMDGYLEWRKSVPINELALMLGSVSGLGDKVLPINAREYRNLVSSTYSGDLDAFKKATESLVNSWDRLFPPADYLTSRYWNQAVNPAERKLYEQFRSTRSVEDFCVINTEGAYIRNFICLKYTNDIDNYNKAHITSHKSYDELRLPRRAPTGNPKIRADWEQFVRNSIYLMVVKLDESLAPNYRAFLKTRYPGIAQYNAIYGTSLTSFDQAPFVSRLDDNPRAEVDFRLFLKDAKACPIEGVSIHGPAEKFAEFMKGKGVDKDRLPQFGQIIARADYLDCLRIKSKLRWEFSTRNYKQVFGYIALHGNGIINTIIYCALAIITHLLVNPIAAYALSRYSLPSTYKILLFCMATMAFPGEVTMIPAFILLKRFPLLPLIIGVATALLVFIIFERFVPKRRDIYLMLGALGAGALVGAGAFPLLFPSMVHTTLLNSFAALILPGMASGYSIFLLKGFFDSLPRELYEAAEIDGANEWIKFWNLTIRLSSPILAVIALGAFMSAYSAFMMALIIIPDQKMWTIMVWIFQLQSNSTLAGVYAALVIAAIPTFLVFVFCQNIIMRGIVVPTEK